MKKSNSYGRLIVLCVVALAIILLSFFLQYTSQPLPDNNAGTNDAYKGYDPSKYEYKKPSTSTKSEKTGSKSTGSSDSTPSKSTGNVSGKGKKSDPYDAHKYKSAQDFADDKYEEFYDYEDDFDDEDEAYDAAEDYWNDHH